MPLHALWVDSPQSARNLQQINSRKQKKVLVIILMTRVCFSQASKLAILAHQNRTIAIASDFRVDGANRQKSRRKKGF